MCMDIFPAVGVSDAPKKKLKQKGFEFEQIVTS